jgi:hypothetical protein
MMLPYNAAFFFMRTLAESGYEPEITFRKLLMTDACWRFFFSPEAAKERRLKERCAPFCTFGHRVLDDQLLYKMARNL